MQTLIISTPRNLIKCLLFGPGVGCGGGGEVGWYDGHILMDLAGGFKFKLLSRERDCKLMSPQATNLDFAAMKKRKPLKEAQELLRGQTKKL